MKKEPIAVVGIGAIFPGAQEYQTFWNNALTDQCFIREITSEYWDAKDFYDADPAAADKTYGRAAGMVDPIPFDAMEFGIPPKVMHSIGPEQLYALAVVRQALIDAGMYGERSRPFDRSRVGVVFSAGISKTAFQLSCRVDAEYFKYSMRNCSIPEDIIKLAVENFRSVMNDWDEDSHPGYLPNVTAGRVANRFDFGGTNCTVDAACAGSLAALKYALSELWLESCDVMIAGALQLDLSEVTFISFSKTPALSKKGEIHPFDERADGMILGDGTGAVVLKRLSKAEAEGDRIYALIEGVGGSSDGREKSIFAPSRHGQVLAVTRALEDAGVKASQIGMVEAHGTGTDVGDECEIGSLTDVYGPRGPQGRRLVLSGGKGQTGHMRLAAGVASLIRAALCVYHKQFIPLAGCARPSRALLDSGLYACRRPEPWVVNGAQPVRYAEVSAFGFGGTNFSVILKEHGGEQSGRYRLGSAPRGVLLEAAEPEALRETIYEYIALISDQPGRFACPEHTYRPIPLDHARVAFAAADAAEAKDKAMIALRMLEGAPDGPMQMKGVLYAPRAILGGGAKAAVLFSGQGGQYPQMFAETACAYPELRAAFSAADDALLGRGGDPVSGVVYARAMTEEEKQAARQKLDRTRYAQPALAAVECGLFDLMSARGLRADIALGHSFGELPALYAAGAFDRETLMRVASARGECMDGACPANETGMLAVLAPAETARRLAEGFRQVSVANVNGPLQTVLSGDRGELSKLAEAAAEGGIKTVMLRVSAAFHSPYMERAGGGLREALENAAVRAPSKAVYSNCSAAVYEDAASVRAGLCAQLTSPVLFGQCLENAYRDGARLFLEIGPGKTLTGFVADCLKDRRDWAAVAVNADAKGDSLAQVETALAHLAALGMEIGDDAYRAQIDPQVFVKPGKTVFAVDPTFFRLPQDKERIQKAKYTKVAGADWLNAGSAAGNAGTWDGDALYRMQKCNAEAFERYMNSQREQMEKLGGLLSGGAMRDARSVEAVTNCFRSFQDNSLAALKAYFEGSVALAGGAAPEKKEMPAAPAASGSPAIPPPAPQKAVPEEAAAKPSGEIRDVVVKNIAKVTGYPEEMLETDMILESDLGIDSLKRLELFSAVDEELGHIFGEGDLAELAAVRTVEECIATVGAMQTRGTRPGGGLDRLRLEAYQALAGGQNAAEPGEAGQ